MANIDNLIKSPKKTYYESINIDEFDFLRIHHDLKAEKDIPAPSQTY